MGLLISFTRPDQNNQLNDYLQPVYDIRVGGATMTAVHTANTVYLYRFRVSRPITIANAHIYVGATSAGNYALGIYTSDGTTWTRVAATADTAAGSANDMHTVALAAAYVLMPGIDYWSAWGSTDNTLTVMRTTFPNAPGGALKNYCLTKAAVYSSGLPSTITSLSGINIVYWMGLSA
jgi:hypothetical protein